MSYTEEVKNFVLEYLKEHPNSVAINIAKALHERFPEIEPKRKSANQILYSLKSKGLVRKVEIIGKTKPEWQHIENDD